MYQTIPSTPQTGPILPLSYEYREEKNSESESCLKYGAATSTFMFVCFALFMTSSVYIASPTADKTPPPSLDIVDLFPDGLFSYYGQSDDVKLAYFENFIFKFKKQVRNNVKPSICILNPLFYFPVQ